MTDPSTLVSAYLFDTLTESQAAELREWILADSANADRVARETLACHIVRDWIVGNANQRAEQAIATESDLADRAGEEFDGVDPETVRQLLDELELEDEATATTASDDMASPDRPVEERAATARNKQKKWSAVLPQAETVSPTMHLPTSLLYGIAAMIAVVTGFYFLSTRETINGPPVATLTAAIEAKWSDTTVPTETNRRLGAGELRLVRGRVWIRLDGGAQIGLTAPATFALDKTDRLTLRRGKLVGYCPPKARGFEVRTPSGNVVDLGTEFGVDVDEQGVAEVHVLAGKVSVRPVSTNDNAAGTFELVAGHASRIDARDGSVQAIVLSVDAFRSLRPLLGRNLVVNGDFEMDEPGEVVRRVPPIFSDITITGWDDRNRAMTIAYDQPDSGGDFPKPGRDAVPTNHGRCFFMSAERESTTSQSIDLSALRGQIDARQIDFELSGWIGGYGDQDDTLTIRAVALNDRGEETPFAQLGPIHSRDRNNESGFWKRSKEGELPVGTRRVRIDLVAKSFDTSTTNVPDAYADNVSLTLSLKQPVATAQ